MELPQIEILLIAILTSSACALVGSFLVLRGMAMMSDAISHTILLGIVLAFFITKDLTSPLLIVGAAIIGVLTVVLVEMLQKTRLVSEDSSIGTIFPLLFSIGIILISMYAGNVHLDTDAVLLGELAFAPFERLIINDLDFGAKSIYIMGVILLINLLYVLVFYKELKLVTFDPLLAASIGIFPALIHYSLMTLVSITTVGAFNAVGAILVVALMIVPSSTAFFLVEDLKSMLLSSVGFSILSAVSGFIIAFKLDISIAGSIAVMSGIIFAIVFVLSPKKGLITILRRKEKQKYEFLKLTLLLYLLNHQHSNKVELKRKAIISHLGWNEDFLEEILEYLIQDELINNREIIEINEKGTIYLASKAKDYEIDMSLVN